MNIWEALYLLNPVLAAFLVTMILSCLLPSGFLKFPYNAVSLLASLGLICRGLTWFCHNKSLADYADVTNFHQLLIVDSTSSFACVLLGIAAFIYFLMAPRYLERKGMHTGEFYLLSLVSLAGMVLTVSTKHFTGLFLGIETMTIPLYFLMAMDRRHNEGRLAALKYLILGGLGSALLLYGIAMIYGATDPLNGSYSQKHTGKGAGGIHDQQLMEIGDIRITCQGFIVAKPSQASTD